MLPVQKPAGTSDDDQPGDPPSNEPFLVISEEAAQNTQHWHHMFDLLNTAEPILPELFRDTQVFKTSGNLSGLATRDQLPDEFFYQTKEEVKRSLEQQQRIIEESGMLMTKAMRQRLRVQEVRLKVRAWITDCFAIPSVEYQLWAPPGTVAASRSNLPPTARAELTNDVLTLTEYGLAPCSLITLSIPQASSTDQPVNLLRPDLLANATSL
ncbi:unnamed protein product [Dicrocoelium dendriticum]|nr:unnamed protein product [Dicrocoelium dendriticum]